MKRNFFSFLLVFIGVFCLFSCGEKKGGKVICELHSVEPTQVVISVTEEEGDGTLLNGLEYLREKGEISFKTKTDKGGLVMLTELNGKSNGGNDYWMLYTSDEEMANTAWGEVEYNGKTLGSAALGAADLKVEEGEIYLFIYTTF